MIVLRYIYRVGLPQARIYIIALMVLLINILGLQIIATQAQTLSINTTTDGTLATNEQDTYTFIAREGQILSFVARSSDDLDVMIMIEDLNGRTLLSNDDYDSASSRDAIIEGFVAPYTGSYSVIVAGYGTTTGNYTIDMLAGYSTLTVQIPFDEDSGWEAVGLDLVDLPSLNIVNGTANLIQGGIDRVGLGIGLSPNTDIYYVQATIDSISDTAGWRTGIVFGYQDQQNFYRMTVNYRGAWRIVALKNGEETVLRDWNVHPAIIPDTRTFSLGILVNTSSFDVFYNEQYIGSTSDDTFQSGQVGIVAETVNAIGSEVTIRFDTITITAPTFIDNDPIFPTSLIANGTNSTIRELQQRLLIPPNGDVAYTLSESFAQNNQEGVSRFAIGDGRTNTNFALGARVSWVATNADLNGCGFVVRDDGNENYIFAYIDSEGGFGISERSGNEFIQNNYNTRIDLQRPPYDIVLIVRDDVIHYYVNNRHAISMTVGVREGVIAEAVVNFVPVNTNCQFNNVWVWEW